jgi:hypothetical protein
LSGNTLNIAAEAILVPTSQPQLDRAVASSAKHYQTKFGHTDG